MQTIGRKWPADAPRGDFQMDCSDCGARFRRSQCRKARDGMWRCRDCDQGMDQVTLAEGNAKAASSRRVLSPREGGGYSTRGFPDPTTGVATEVATQRTDRGDI